jgi:hypothetical protein
MAQHSRSLSLSYSSQQEPESLPIIYVYELYAVNIVSIYICKQSIVIVRAVTGVRVSSRVCLWQHEYTNALLLDEIGLTNSVMSMSRTCRSRAFELRGTNFHDSHVPVAIMTVFCWTEFTECAAVVSHIMRPLGPVDSSLNLRTSLIAGYWLLARGDTVQSVPCNCDHFLIDSATSSRF